MTDCAHVYENRGVDICDLCGKDTHEINWAQQNELHRQWKLEHPNATSDGWWSI